MQRANFTRLDYVVIILYLFIGMFIFLSYYLDFLEQEIINTSILILGFGGTFGLYGLYYKRLRILKVLSVWALISLIQIVIYLNYKQHTDFFSTIGKSYLEYLINLPILIIVFSVLRYLYWLMYKEELIITSGGMKVGRVFLRLIYVI